MILAAMQVQYKWIPVAYMGAQDSMSVTTQDSANYAISPPQVIDSLSEWNLPPLFYVGAVVFAFYFQSDVTNIYINGAQPFSYTPL